MRRLLHVISFTTDIERSKAFYRDGIGLSVVADTPFMVNFAPDGGGLMLLAVHPNQKREVELCFESDDVTTAVDRLRSRGVQFTDELRHLAFGSVIHFRDPETNLLSILQPGASTQGKPSARGKGRAATREGARETEETVVAVAESAGAGTTDPRISTAIVNCRDLAAGRAYYAHLLGLRVSVDSSAWVQFDTGDIRLALFSLRDRNAVEQYHAQPVSFGFTVDDMDGWVEDARARGVEFVSAPSDEGFGLTAEVADPEGNIVVVREPISEATLEERLAEAFEDDIPGRVAMRSPLRKAARHASWVAQRPEYKPPKRAASAAPGKAAADEKRAERATGSTAPRGAGASGKSARAKPIADGKRPRVRSAIGRLKKAEARTLSTAKRAAASASKSKPVKKAASRTASARASAKKAAARRGGRAR